MARVGGEAEPNQRAAVVKMPRGSEAVAAIVPAAAEDEDVRAVDAFEHFFCDVGDGTGSVLHQDDAGNVEVLDRAPIDFAKLISG